MKKYKNIESFRKDYPDDNSFDSILWKRIGYDIRTIQGYDRIMMEQLTRDSIRQTLKEFNII